MSDITGFRNGQVELHFSTCARVYKVENDVPGSYVSLRYNVDKNFLVQKLFFLIYH